MDDRLILRCWNCGNAWGECVCLAAMPDESRLPIAEQSLEFRLLKRAQIRRTSRDRRSVQEGRPDRLTALLEEAAVTLLEVKRERDDLKRGAG